MNIPAKIDSHQNNLRRIPKYMFISHANGARGFVDSDKLNTSAVLNIPANRLTLFLNFTAKKSPGKKLLRFM